MCVLHVSYSNLPILKIVDSTYLYVLYARAPMWPSWSPGVSNVVEFAGIPWNSGILGMDKKHCSMLLHSQHSFIDGVIIILIPEHTTETNVRNMATFENSVADVLTNHLSGLEEDVIDYLIAIVDDMSLDERRSCTTLQETIGPFLVDSGVVESEDGTEAFCQKLVIAFGGSGFRSKVPDQQDNPSLTLLAAPVKIIDRSGLNGKPAATYGGVVFASIGSDTQTSGDVNHNTTLDAKAIPKTQKEARKMRKENDRLQKILRAEEMARMEAEAEMSAARMAAIIANRSGGRQATTGVSIERFSIPHPSGTSDLLTDAALVLATGRRYGLVGKNGAGNAVRKFFWGGGIYHIIDLTAGILFCFLFVMRVIAKVSKISALIIC